jgi:hypothetical protein
MMEHLYALMVSILKFVGMEVKELGRVGVEWRERKRRSKR